MKSDQYWSERLEQLNEAQLSKGEEYIRKMNDEYGKAMSSIQKDIDVFYQRFANNNAVSLAEARQILKAGELKEFKWTVEDYIKKGEENAIDQRWMKELENASIKVRVSRLEALQIQMQQHVEMLAASKQKGITDLLGDKVYKDNYYRSIFEMQKGAGIGSSFAKLDGKFINNVLSTPWAPDGSNFSERIWKDRTKLVAELQTTLMQGFIRGDPSEKLIKHLSERMGVSRSSAARLVLTEAAYFSGQSRLQAYNELGVEEYKYTATLDKRTSALCRQMDGKVFAISEAQPGVNYPPLHGHCRSTTIPHYEGNVKERVARDDGDETYVVPGDMTYKEWAGEYVSKATGSGGSEPTPPKPDSGEPQTGKSAPELEKWYDETSETKPKLVRPKDIDLDEMEPGIPRKLGDIEVFKDADPFDGEAFKKYLKESEEAIRTAEDEHAVVITPKGEVYHIKGDKRSVEIDKVEPDKLKDSVVTHNHPDDDDDPGGSFSYEDVLVFFAYELEELRAVDSTYQYSLSLVEKLQLSEEEVRMLLYQAEINYKSKLTIQDVLAGYDEKHLLLLELVLLIEWLLYERT